MFRTIKQIYLEIVKDLYYDFLTQKHKLRKGKNNRLYWVNRKYRYMLNGDVRHADDVILKYANKNKIKEMTEKQTELRLETY